MHLRFDDSSQSENVPPVGIRKHRYSFTAIDAFVPSISLFAHQSDPQDSESRYFQTSLEPVGHIAAVLLTGSCIMWVESELSALCPLFSIR